MNIVQQIVSSINEKDLEKARNLISKNEKKFSKNVDFLSAKAMFYINIGEHRSAVNILKSAIEIEPDSNDLYYNLAFAYEMLDGASVVGNMGESNSNIIIKKYTKRVNHEKGTLMPIRSKCFASAIEVGAPLVSVIVLAYNKLEYTKQCIESIYRYTNDVDYELIVVDNGSTDETFEYFKSLPKKRIVRLEENQGPGHGFNEGIKASRGKYVAGVCNDFIFTKNWLSNLVKCAESDEGIGYISPGASYISNVQQINLNFSNIDEMQVEAEKYNISDPKKWEERVRLMPNVLFIKREVLDIVGLYDPAFYYGEFADDDISFRIRRAGYKLIYCGDTYTYHHGHVTVGIDQREKNSMEVSRKFFIDKYYGIDPWIDVKYDFNLVGLLDLNKLSDTTKIRILGIDVRCGNTLLMIKNKLKQEGFNNIDICSYVKNPLYYEDLRTICSKVGVGDAENVFNEYKDELFDIIVFDESINTYYNPEKLIEQGYLLLNQSGQMVISFINSYDINNFMNVLVNSSLSNDEIKSNFNFEKFLLYLQDKNYYNINVLKEYHSLTMEDNNLILNIAKKVSLNNNIESLLDKFKTKRYILNLQKL